jgi:hypothetical protein
MHSEEQYLKKRAPLLLKTKEESVSFDDMQRSRKHKLRRQYLEVSPHNDTTMEQSSRI